MALNTRLVWIGWVASLIVLLSAINACIATAGSAKKLGVHRSELVPFSPVARAEAMVMGGPLVRFTILTDSIVRIERRATTAQEFEDRATLAFLNRQMPLPEFSSMVTQAGVLRIRTKALSIAYEVCQPFNAQTLTIRSNDPTGFTWHYGQRDNGNLLGTIRSLDEVGALSLNCTVLGNMTISDESMHCAWGLVSRDGWVVVNDTDNYALTAPLGATPNAQTPAMWWDGPNRDAEDLYFFGHGLDYKAALKEFTLLSGPIAMVPRYAAGVMWSRWRNLDVLDVQRIVGEYESHNLPLDVFILDMDWHTKEGWGGYTFDKRLFPDPSYALAWLHNKRLHTSVNQHDADGVRPTETMHDELARYMGLNPATCGTLQFSIVNASYGYGLEDVVIKHLTDLGIDFSWIDWQQGGTPGGGTGGKQNPTIWLNHLRSTDHMRWGEPDRGMILSRWGGLGNHRYQVGFSGDVAGLTWANLAYQPYFSLTASNVGYGFWSHDIVGPHTDHTLHARWVQWGAYSAVFRTHDRGMAGGACADQIPESCAIVELWKVPSPYFEAIRSVIRAREALIPYIYTAYRDAFDTGISIIRPMYYAYPHLSAAYATSPTSAISQYTFCGEDMIIAPIVSAPNATTEMSAKTVWLPPGSWMEKDSGTMYHVPQAGGALLVKSFDIGEVPVYMRAGSVVPIIRIAGEDWGGRKLAEGTLGIAMDEYTPLGWILYPGASTGMGRVYEDDARTTAYIDRNEYVWTTAKYARSESSLSFTIISHGDYSSFPRSRPYRLRIVNALPAAEVSVEGSTIPFRPPGSTSEAQNGGWWYDGEDMALIVDTPEMRTSMPVTIKVTFIAPVNDTFLSGLKGVMKHASLAKNLLDAAWSTPGGFTVQGGNISVLASTAVHLTHIAGGDAHAFMDQVRDIPRLLSWTMQEIAAIRPKESSTGAYNRWAHAWELLVVGARDINLSRSAVSQLKSLTADA